MKDSNYNKTVLVNGHNHHSDKKQVDKSIFDKTLQQICEKNSTLSPLLCYKDAKEQLKGKIDRKNIPMLSSYCSLIYRSQRLKIPLQPKNTDEFEEIIKEAKNHQRFAFDDGGNIFYRGVWRGTSGNNLAFVSERTLQEVSKRQEVTLLMDGTFKAVPKNMGFIQLYIINVIIRGRCFPLAYILMERKDFNSYMVVFDELKKLLPSMNVVECMSDFEAATRKAILLQFPRARLSGCYFHYVQAIMKACKRFGLMKYADADKFKLAVNKIAALALLPNEYIKKGFDCISERFTNSVRWNRFKEYWLSQWQKANISVYRLKHRTNNFSETLNRTINKLNGSKHPHIWKLILNLQSLDMLKSDELEQVVLGLMSNRKKKETIRLNEKIKRATELFDETRDLEQFLDNVTFNDDLSNIYNLRESVHDDLDEYDEIIPNDYNEQTEFRKKHQRKAVKRKASSTICNSKKKKK